MHAPLETGLKMPPPSEWGPAMSALKSDRQRAYVVACFEVRPGKGVSSRAARLAGYGSRTSSAKSISVIAARLANDEQVQLAIEEEGRHPIPVRLRRSLTMRSGIFLPTRRTGIIRKLFWPRSSTPCRALSGICTSISTNIGSARKARTRSG